MSKRKEKRDWRDGYKQVVAGRVLFEVPSGPAPDAKSLSAAGRRLSAARAAKDNPKDKKKD